MRVRDNESDHPLNRRSLLGLAAAAVITAGLPGCSQSPRSGSTASPSATVDPDDPRAIAADACVFGYPLVLMDITRTTAAAANRFYHAQNLPTSSDRAVVRMNLDTLYSSAWLDLGPEPMVLQAPAMPGGRYWLMQIMDAWSNTVADPSSTDPQPAEQQSSPPFTYVITGPEWSGPLPGNLTRLSVPTPTAWLIGRIQVNGEDDLPAVHTLQQQLRLVPLSAWIAGTRTPSESLPRPQGDPPADQISAMDAKTFFNRLCAVLAVNPPAPADDPMMKRIAAIGITPGGNVDAQPAEPLAAGIKDARHRIVTYRDPEGKDVNGWKFATNLGAYGIDYLLRANVADTALGATLSRDALYPTVSENADDRGTPRRFRLKFPAGQLPPADAFWSLTAYTAESYLVQNDADIYSVGHAVPIVPGPDGSVEFAVQHDDPGPAVPKGNWLPIPAAGRFSLTLRLYAPKPEALDGTWQPPRLITQPAS
ncbi:DUF1254 domain-containing protein [Nocardia seriolae]|nr:DUF1254 domain-containing protein [Nocardia seriolae]MTJ72857.1 DUF1254 domain-containing protein [Nocardia seriolae]MTJ89246.1 DUF1254 domain-containing protein [Nocardia seriolae]MTK33224.1 DUF1254 domain-containing protein [Nocardia seriolae]MTK40581.1 DUF1254 domain-containing protein [Nocardia seriolae]